MSAEASVSSSGTPPVFTYTGEDGVKIPPSFEHLRVHPSVKVIPRGAFRGLQHLIAADLPEGLLEIGAMAFSDCGSLSRVNFPSTLLRVGDRAFSSSRNHVHVKLVEARLPEGLEKIGEGAFADCPLLETISIPSTVKVIPPFAFIRCERLKSVELSKGLREILSHAFYYCKSLERIDILPSTVTRIGDSAFTHCWKISELTIPEGLRKIGRTAFKSCHSLRQVTTPSALSGEGSSAFGSLSIGQRAFDSCHSMSMMDLPDSVEIIGEHAFSRTGVQSFRVPRRLKKFDWDVLCVNGNLFSIELPYTLNEMEGSSCLSLRNLRNVAIPPHCMCPPFVFIDLAYSGREGNEISDLRKAFPSSNSSQIALALKQRFNGLPIHRLCYYHSYTAGASEKLNTLCRYAIRYDRDILGMTPLHILACSSKHHLELYRLVIGAYPENLIAEDEWGDVPLFYAFWSHAPTEVIQLLVKTHKSSFPDQSLNWRKMLATLGRANASLTCIKTLIETHQAFFCNDRYELQGIITELAESGRTLKKTVRFLLEHDVSKRLSLLAVEGWEKNIECMVEGCFNMRAIHPDHRDCTERGQGAENIAKLYYHLALYDQLKVATSLLELALWKAKIKQCMLIITNRQEEEGCAKEEKVVGSAKRNHCRISCGANIVVPNVLVYLLPSFDKPPSVMTGTVCRR